MHQENFCIALCECVSIHPKILLYSLDMQERPRPRLSRGEAHQCHLGYDCSAEGERAELILNADQVWLRQNRKVGARLRHIFRTAPPSKCTKFTEKGVHA